MTEQEKIEKVLKERAEKYKKPREADVLRGDYIKALEFLLGDERYALDSTFVNEVILIHELTPLPCTPDFIAGIINLRGRILSVVDIKKFLNLPLKGISNLNRVIIVQYGDIELGILADEILGNPIIYIDQIQSKITNITNVHEGYLMGVADENLIVLDIKELLESEKLIIDEEVL